MSKAVVTDSLLSSRVPRIPELYKLVVQHVAHKWEGLCISLEFDEDGAKLEAIRRDFIQQGVEKCCLQVLLYWVRGNGKPANWRTMITCLQDMEMHKVVRDIKEALSETDHEISEVGSESTALPAPLTIPDITSLPANRYQLKPGIEEELRDYQWELALPGLSGQNYIVCAPTGSGKTRVAGLVISEHLKQMKGHGKVLFVVNKVPLVQQQRTALQDMIHGAKLEEVSGDMAQHKKAMLSASLQRGTTDHSPSGTIDRPSPSGTIDCPSPSGTADRPSPSGTADRPSPSGTADCPSPSGTADRPSPSGTADRPSPSGTADHPSPSGTADGTVSQPCPSGATECTDHASSSEEENSEGAWFNLDNDIIVCTAGCLFNELNDKRMSLSAISLLVIDECHNTRKKSDYARIMKMYISAKLSGEEGLPQVLGLTATPGAGDSARPNMTTVLDHLVTFCAAMDAEGGIQIVTNNVPDLKLHQTSAVHSTATLEGRSDEEPFIALIVGITTILEGLFKMKPPPESKWSQKYSAWVNEALTQSQKKDNSRDKNCILRTLKGLSSVLRVYHNLCYEDAMEELNKLVYPSDEKATTVERNMSRSICQLGVKLSSLERVDNPLLLQLEGILEDKFRTSPQSKAVVFVETKFEATSIDRWIKSRARLCNIRSDAVTGQTRDTGKKMTKAEQTASLSGFRGEECNLLVSTSVLEEGIDVPACNLVIRYQKVTSEIAQVQSRGRARASNSHSVTIVTSKSGKQFQEMLNEEKIALVEQALRMLPTGENLRPLLKAKQQNILKQGSMGKEKLASRKPYNSAEVDVHCRSCSAFLCNAAQICTIPTTLHYVVKDDDFLSNVRVKVHHKPAHIPCGLSRTHKLYCKQCDVQSLGVLGKWWSHDVQYPVLKCMYIKFKINREYLQCRQWKDVPFEVSPLN